MSMGYVDGKLFDWGYTTLKGYINQVILGTWEMLDTYAACRMLQ